VAAFYSYVPAPPLSSYVDCFWLYEESDQPYEYERVLPTGKPALWIDLGGDGLRASVQQDLRWMKTFRTSVLLGAHSRWFIAESGRHVSRLGVQFKYGGANPFFTPPAGALHNSNVSLDELWGSAAQELRDRLLAEVTPKAQFQALEQALLAHHVQRRALHPTIAVTLRALLATPRPQTITEVVNQSGLSHRQFIQTFRREVGLAPKMFCRLRRFLHALNQTQRMNEVNWAEVAQTCGYFDQSHLTRDFREFTGVCPTAYLRVRDLRFPTQLPYEPNAIYARPSLACDRPHYYISETQSIR
jgi:AraC-like DNA-binding protein